MKKTLLSLFAFALTMGVNAQVVSSFDGAVQRSSSATQTQSTFKSAPNKATLADNQRIIGHYFTDELAEYGAGLAAYTSGSCKAAIELTANDLKDYAGMKVVGIRFGLCYAIGDSRVFMATVADKKVNSDVVSQATTDAKKGWNTVMLDQPYTLEAGKSYFIGFDYTQKQTKSGSNYAAECYPLSMINSEHMITEGGTMWMYANIPSKFGGSGNAWYDFSSNGILSIQLIVEGTFKQYVVTPFGFELGKVDYKENTASATDITMLNLSKETATSVNYVTKIDGVASEEQQAKVNLAYGNFGTFSAVLPASSTGVKNVTVEVTKVNGNDNLSNTKTAEGKVGIYSFSYPQNVYIEEFTTEKCPNCPRVAGYLKTALSKADASRVYAACHHAGYYTDWLTGTWDEDIVSLVFGGTGSTYAPAIAVNRDLSIAKSGYDQMGVMFMPTSANDITAYINGVSAKEANVKLNMTATKMYDDSEAVVTVEGECNEALDKDNAKLTFYVTEDEIKAKSQSGASGTFYHEHVIRYNNSSWGEDIQWNGNKFTKTFTVPVNSSWVKDNVKFLAIVNGYSKADEEAKVYKYLKVENVTGMKYSDATTGINGVSDDSNATVVARYSIDGVRLSAPQKGLNVMKLSDGRTVKVMVK